MSHKLLMLVACAFFLPASSSTFAAEKIAGAFGFGLGASFDTKLSKAPLANDDDVVIGYRVESPQPNSSFTAYFLWVSPTSKKIAQIDGKGEPQAKDKCKKDWDYIASLLQEKYGKFDFGFKSEFHRKKEVGSRSINLDCERTTQGYRLYVSYLDGKVMDTLDSEAAKIVDLKDKSKRGKDSKKGL